MLVVAFGLSASAASAATSAPTISATNAGASGANGSATGPSGNEECFACHGVKPVDGKIVVDGATYPATIDVNGQQKSIYVDRHIQSNSRHGELACTSCHIGFNAGEHPASVTDGWLQHRQDHRLRQLPQRGDEDVLGVLPRGPHPQAGLGQGAALRRLPRRAQHRPAGVRGVPRSGDAAVRALPRGRQEDLPRQLPRQGVPARLHQDRRLQPVPRRSQDPAGQQSREHGLAAERRRHMRQVPPGRQQELRRLPHAREPAGPALVVADLDLLDRLRAAHHRGLHVRRGPHEPVHLPRRQGRPVLTRAPPPRQARRHAHRVPALQRVPPLDALPRHRELHGAGVHRHAAQVQGHALGQVVHGPVRRRHRGRRLPPPGGHRHHRRTGSWRWATWSSRWPAPGAGTSAARAP